jgi:hypothetical protein
MTASDPALAPNVQIPQTDLADDATSFVRAAADDLLFDHSSRVFYFAALHSTRRSLTPNLELLYVASMFHDLGLTERFRTSQSRFELDGANAARDFLLERGAGEADAHLVWLGIALHTTPVVPQLLAPEIALLNAGVRTDMLGVDLDELSPGDLKAVVAAHPRPDFKRRILEAFVEGLRLRPQTTYGTVNADVLERFVPGFVRESFVDKVGDGAWSE